jgi:hypothetical protein
MDVLPGSDRGHRRPRPRGSAWVWALSGVLVTVLIAGAVAGALRGPDVLDPDRPEGVVQAYLQANLDNDHHRAHGFLSVETAERCTVSDLRQAWIPESITASLDGVRVRADEAEVRVRLRTVAGPEPFGGGGFTTVETFVLTREEGRWRLTETAWPAFDCRSQ